MRTRSTGRFAAVSMLLALSVLGAACGSGSDAEAAAGDGATATSAPSTTAAELQDSGLPSLNDEDQNPAADDSDSLVDDEPVEEEEAFEAYLDCMRGQGIDVDAVEASPIADQEAFMASDEFKTANVECEPILEAAFGSFELDPEMEAALADRSAEMAACGREVLGVEIPDDVLLLDENDPRMLELDALETTPEQDAALEACAEEILGDIIDEDGNLVTPEASE